MKILIITELLTPYRVDWFDELGKSAELKVLYTKETDKSRNRKWLSKRSNNIKCKRLKGFKFKDNEICFEVITELKKDYDIILLDGYSFPTQMLAILYLKIKKKDFFMNIDGGFIRENEKKYIYYIKKFFISSVSYYLSSSIQTDKYLIHYGANLKSIYRHNFTSLFAKDIKKQINTPDEKLRLKQILNIEEQKVIISVGQFIHRKGFDILIKSMRFIPKNYGVYIIGGTPTKEFIDMKKKYNLENLYFIEFKQSEELRKYYDLADLFVLPTREDIWGLVVNEAMASGLPIITTDRCIAGLELVDDGVNGYIIPVEDYNSLAQYIKKILSNDELQIKMSNESLKKISSYTIENMAQTHNNIFEKYERSLHE